MFEEFGGYIYGLVQLRAFRMFFGVGTLHPKVSLLAEMGELPVLWEARVRCVLFWYKVLYVARFVKENS